MSDTNLTRRELLARGAGAVATAGTAALGASLLYDSSGDAGLRKKSDGGKRLKDYFAEVDFPASSPRIALASTTPDPQGTLTAAGTERIVRAAIESLAPSRGMKQFIAKGDVVLVKPNVGFDRSPYMGATTNPEVLRYVIRMCREAGARSIIVADNPIESPDACFAKSRIREVAEDEGARVVLPSQVYFEDLVIRDRTPDARKGEALGRWPIFYSPLAGANKVIGVAPVKDHNLCGASVTMKNWYGLLGGRRNQFHQAIHNIVSDLGMMMSPTLVIADATRVLMRNGPTGGRISDVKIGGELGRPSVVASVDPVACDAWCYEHFLGRQPATLAYLDMTAKKIAAQIAAGSKRFGERDWHVYDRQGKIATTAV